MQSNTPKSKTRVRLLAGAAVATVMGLAVVTALPTISPADTTPQVAAPRFVGTGGGLFAFLVGIPTMFAASGYELLKSMKNGSSAHEDWSALAIAFAVSLVTAFVAVKWLLGYIRTHRFTPFAI